MNKLIIYVHGKGGSAGESEHYRALLPGYDVVGLDYRSATPWEAKRELPALFDYISKGYDGAILIANSIGAYLSMCSPHEKIERAFFISPIVDMNRLISDMMKTANVREHELEEKKLIETDFGEVLSWDYLRYVKENPLQWNTPTDILYGETDSLTPLDVIEDFASVHGASLTVMPNGEHWFHTEEQMRFHDAWITRLLI